MMFTLKVTKKTLIYAIKIDFTNLYYYNNKMTALSLRGYSIRKDQLNLQEIEDIKDTLTVSPFTQDYVKPIYFKVYQESPSRIYLPKAFGLKKFGIPKVNKLPNGDDISIDFIGNLRPEQLKPVQTFINACKDPLKMGGIISVHCGGGKTTMAIYSICELKKKALIVVHKDFLLQQWKERIQQFAPKATIGLLKAKIIDVENKDIVIASLQSLSMKDYDPKLFESFGLVCYDECYPSYQHIITKIGTIPIGEIYNMWKENKEIPEIYSFNRTINKFEWKPVTYAWEKNYTGKLIKIAFGSHEIVCTPDHKQLTVRDGMIPSCQLEIGDNIVANTFYGYKTIVNISYIDNVNCKVYDIEVADTHTYLCCSKNTFEGIVTSNCHHLSAEVFSQAMKKVNVSYTLGLSATPKRKDGLTKVFLWHIGDILFTPKNKKDTVSVEIKNYTNDTEIYSKEELMFNGKLNLSRMINNICNFEPRTAMVIETVKEVLSKESDRKILVLSDRRNHIDEIIKALQDSGVSAAQYYGGLKDTVLKEAEKKTVIGGTFSYTSEGLDIKGLDTLILASPKTEITQICGRILREKEEDRKYVPLIIDIVDNFSIFGKQAKKRMAYYKKCKYDIGDFTDESDDGIHINEYAIV
jgi:superfamily II DNA or RNA helicase